MTWFWEFIIKCNTFLSVISIVSKVLLYMQKSMSYSKTNGISTDQDEWLLQAIVSLFVYLVSERVLYSWLLHMSHLLVQWWNQKFWKGVYTGSRLQMQWSEDAAPSHWRGFKFNNFHSVVVVFTLKTYLFVEYTNDC